MNFMDDPLWYKDAIIYELHVKAFFDASNDGTGDFTGLIEKLDYLEELGVNTIWLLPFYPSPMRDDGYDIADYHNVHPVYGSREDVRKLIREVHKRQMRIITELVINHTSDQHPWFQAARHAPVGSAKRDFYVWSDSKLKFPETRIIFTDSEDSNWAWDDVAQAYYWHRFFSHQPDLNFDNPQVVKAVIRAMRFWLDMGVDALRLDAIPYLCVREGSNNENLPETHQVIKQMRAVVDAHYQGRMFLAEANQWPEDVLEYFGAGDECHMAYHFPLMPRMYMALAQEDRFPMTDILNQTPAIPENCQWALFLRNHDELTLEMVTDRERDYMYQVYASDLRMRVNVGIRRRLAPLLENDLDKIKLLNCLLMTLPGTPIVYYGDEIGMGDNFYLGDRNGVRTPMQWSPDRNAGFSRADPQRLFLPPIMDPVYGYQAVNVEAQARNPSSLLNWMRRLIAVRRSHPAFGRGELRLLAPGNHKIFAYLRLHQEQIILCVANLSHSPQPVELDLHENNGRVPVELMSHNTFPPIGELPYLLTLPRYGFYWFELSQEAPPPTWHENLPPLESVPMLVLTDPHEYFLHKAPEMTGYQDVIAPEVRRRLEKDFLPQYLAHQRWFSGKAGGMAHVDFEPFGVWKSAHGCWLFANTRVAYTGGEVEEYSLPLTLRWGDSDTLAPEHLPRVLGRVRRKARPGLLLEAQAEDAFCRDIVGGIGERLKFTLPHGHLAFTSTSAYPDWVPQQTDWPVAHPALEQSNTTVMLDDKLVLKLFRKSAPGLNPEWEMGRFLTEHTNYRQIAPTLGALEWVPEQGEATLLAILQGYIENQGNAWDYTLSYLSRFLENWQAEMNGERAEPETSPHVSYCAQIRLLGQRTGELHQALAVPAIEAFGSEPLAEGEADAWAERVRLDVGASLDQLADALAHLPEPIRPQAEALIGKRTELEMLARNLRPSGLQVVKIRYHGDYHLGQVLVSGSDFVIIDFEGEPARTLAERRRKGCPLRDVAGMLRSFDYAAAIAGSRAHGESPVACAALAQLTQTWRHQVKAAFLEGYREGIADCPACPQDLAQADKLIRLFLLEKALYELRYELANRPLWVHIPLDGLTELLEEQT
jgi:maltose alpha-D-glucosyltransferase/alpha-amylase